MTGQIVRPRRSFIFSPGLKPEMFPRALASGTDIVCVELEDGIAPRDKAEARRKALQLFESEQADDGVERIREIAKPVFIKAIPPVNIMARQFQLTRKTGPVTNSAWLFVTDPFPGQSGQANQAGSLKEYCGLPRAQCSFHDQRTANPQSRPDGWSRPPISTAETSPPNHRGF